MFMSSDNKTMAGRRWSWMFVRGREWSWMVALSSNACLYSSFIYVLKNFFIQTLRATVKFEFTLKKEIDNYTGSFLTKSHHGSKLLYSRFHKNLVLQCYSSFKPSFLY